MYSVPEAGHFSGKLIGVKAAFEVAFESSFTKSKYDFEADVVFFDVDFLYVGRAVQGAEVRIDREYLFTFTAFGGDGKLPLADNRGISAFCLYGRSAP